MFIVVCTYTMRDADTAYKVISVFSSLRIILFKTSTPSTSVAPFFVRGRTCAYIILFLLRDGGTTRISTIHWNNNNSYIPIYILWATHKVAYNYVAAQRRYDRLTDSRPSHNCTRDPDPNDPYRMVGTCNRRHRCTAADGAKFAPPNPLKRIVLRKTTVLFVWFFFLFKILSPFAFIYRIMIVSFILYTRLYRCSTLYWRGLIFRGGTKVVTARGRGVGGNSHYAPTPAAPDLYACIIICTRSPMIS